MRMFINIILGAVGTHLIMSAFDDFRTGLQVSGGVLILLLTIVVACFPPISFKKEH